MILIRRTVIAGVVAAACVTASACGHHPNNTPVISAPDLTRLPTGITWHAYQGISVPYGADGPRDVSDASATGFSATPQGAALAAIVHTVRVSIAPDAHWASIAAAEVAPNAGKDSWAANRMLFSINGPADPATAPHIAGYRITSYVPNSRGEVLVYSALPDGSVAGNHIRVVWIGGDWRLELPEPGAVASSIESLKAVPGDIVRLAVSR